jgi:hypothetical protein
MRKVGFFIVWALVLAFVGLGGSGCDETQLQRIDRIVADANTAGQGVAAIPEGPAGALIPPDVKMIMELLGVGLAMAYAIWQQLRASGVLRKNADLSVTLKAVADGIDQAGPEAENAKTQIQAVMMQRHVFDTADQVIDEHRSKKTAT